MSGRDVAGVVDLIGDAVTNLAVGDAVFTLTDYTRPQCGAFQDYCIAHHASVVKIPSGLTFEEAAAVPVGVITAAVALQRYMGLHLRNSRQPRDEREWILVWGGATCTGYFAIQLANLYGYRVVAVAGQRNRDYVYEAGAEIVLDREESPSSIVHEIRRVTSGSLKYAFDSVGGETAGLCVQALDGGGAGPASKYLAALAGVPARAKKVRQDGTPLELSDGSIVHIPEIKVKMFHTDIEFGAGLISELTKFLEAAQLRIPRIMVMGGGLEVVNEGISLLKKGRISGCKLVIRVDRTRDRIDSIQYCGWL